MVSYLKNIPASGTWGFGWCLLVSVWVCGTAGAYGALYQFCLFQVMQLFRNTALPCRIVDFQDCVSSVLVEVTRNAGVHGSCSFPMA